MIKDAAGALEEVHSCHYTIHRNGNIKNVKYLMNGDYGYFFFSVAPPFVLLS